MPHYTFTFKKGDISVNFTTTDKYIVERQFQLWVQEASEYASAYPKKPAQDIQRKNESESRAEAKQKPEFKQEQKVEEKIEPKAEPRVEAKIEPKMEPKMEPKVELEQKSETETFQPQPEVKVAEPEIIDSIPEGSSEVFDKASSLLKTINSIQNEASTKDSDKEQAEEAIEEVTQPTPETVDFEKVLETKIENSTFEPVKNKDDNFLAFIASKNTEDKFHYLLLTAFYLLEYEQIGRFTLKLINSKLMQNISEIVDHSVLKAAIEQNLIELVPDLTGMAEVAEYRLTEKGEDFIHTRI